MSDAAGSPVAEPFEDLEQERAARRLGMWVFLATEVLFFGGLFTGYAVYRAGHPAAFAEASRRLDVLLGALNTSVLLTSSFTMATAVRLAREGSGRRARAWLALTAALGAAFLAVKGFEYAEKFRERLVPGASFGVEGPHAPAERIFFSFYFVMTGLHALHMLVGLGVVAAVARRLRDDGPVELAGLYWHFVDVVWIYLFPLLYLVSRHA